MRRRASNIGPIRDLNGAFGAGVKPTDCPVKLLTLMGRDATSLQSQTHCLRSGRPLTLALCSHHSVSREDIEHFKELWAEFDPKATSTMPAEQLPNLVRQLRPPMGLMGAPVRWAVRFCLNLGLTHENGLVNFEDVLNALVRHNYSSQLQEDIPAAAGEMQGNQSFKGKLWAQGELDGKQWELAMLFAKTLIGMVNRVQALEPSTRRQRIASRSRRIHLNPGRGSNSVPTLNWRKMASEQSSHARPLPL